MKYLYTLGAFLIISTLFTVDLLQAQISGSQQFRLGEGVIRIAEPGELSDRVSLWGDINQPGRYLVPRGTTLPNLISYARGPGNNRSARAGTIDWDRIRVEINVSRVNQGGTGEELFNFQYRYSDGLPSGMRNFEIQPEDIVSVEIKRRPNFRDYLGVIGPIASLAATTLLVIDRL